MDRPHRRDAGRHGRQPRLRAGLGGWVGQQDKDQAKVDGIGREIFYASGIQGYLDWSHGQAGDSCTIFLHSHGQDAFDSLSHYSREVVDFVHARGCTGLNWAEARHDRPDHRLEWP